MTTFATDGFLSAAMSDFKSNSRGDPRFKGWFDFADDLNRLALAMIRDREIDRKNKPGLCIALFFVRAHHSFQSTLILTELGLLNDARVVLRSAVEGVIAMNAIAADPKFLTKLSEAYFYNQRKTARLALDDPTYRAHQAPDKIAQMEAMVLDVGQMERKEGRRLRDINWREVAEPHSIELYDLLYRPLSSDGTHSNMAALYRFAEFDSNEIMTGLRGGPDTQDMEEVLVKACISFMTAVDRFRLTHAPEYTDKVMAMTERFSQLQ